MNNKIKLICSECRKGFELYPSQVYYQQLHRKLKEWFCSKKCYGSWLGKHYGWGKGKHTRDFTVDIGSHKKTHKWLQNHSKEIVEYILGNYLDIPAHNKRQTAIHFQVYPQIVDSALYMNGYKVPKSYLNRRSK